MKQKAKERLNQGKSKREKDEQKKKKETMPKNICLLLCKAALQLNQECREMHGNEAVWNTASCEHLVTYSMNSADMETS
jgi:hypothetical protein